MDRTKITRALELLEAPVPGVQELLLETTVDGPGGPGHTRMVAALQRDDARALFDALGAWLLETDDMDPRYVMVVHPDANAVVKTRRNGDDVITLEWTPEVDRESGTVVEA